MKGNRELVKRCEKKSLLVGFSLLHPLLQFPRMAIAPTSSHISALRLLLLSAAYGPQFTAGHGILLEPRPRSAGDENGKYRLGAS
jgi:hypothetical protein